MLKMLFNLEDRDKIVDMELLYHGSLLLLIALLAGAVLYTIYYYRSVRHLPAKGRRAMGVCLFGAATILIIIVAMPAAKVRVERTYRPTMLILVDTSRSMAVHDKRVTPEAIAEAAKILNNIPLDSKATEAAIKGQLGKADKTSRLDLVKALFAHEDIDLLNRVGKRFDIRFFSFASSLEPEGGAEDAEAWLASRTADGETSRIGSAMREAVSRYAGVPLAGVIVFSDFNWVEGEDPGRAATELRKRGIPVYPITIGLELPPDASISGIIAPKAVFRGDPVSLRVRIISSGLDGQSTTLTLKSNGVAAQTEQVVFEGGVQYVDLTFKPKQRAGILQLDFELDGTSADSNVMNNTAQHRLKIIEEKIKVLYVEGMPRWEFRYLRWVLLRNKNLKTRFLMTLGDPELAKISRHFISRFPKDVRNIFEYDLIILGDVSSKYFKPGQLELLETQIREHGGSLLMLAGSVAAPRTYQNTPIERLLPVSIGVGKMRKVRTNEYPILTVTGALNPITALGSTPEVSQRIWSKVRPMYQLPSLDGPKPGATVLLELPGKARGAQGYPLVSYQPYGKGKCMFVATDNLWRLRLEVGDEHHAKFWGQAIQYLAMSRLLGQNKRISLQTEREQYSPGEAVRIYANVLSESYEPVEKESHTVVIERRGDVDSAKSITLVPDPAVKGMYFGTYVAGDDGDYVLRAQGHEREISSSFDFAVAEESLEDRDTSAKPDIAQGIALASGGQVVRPVNVGEFVDTLKAQEQSRIISKEMDLWDSPLLYLLLVLLGGLEWYLRRKENLV